jgi:hypothetical protein
VDGKVQSIASLHNRPGITFGNSLPPYSIEPKEGTMIPSVPAPDLPFVDQLSMAERELSAFFAAVEILFGSMQVKLSAEDWLIATEQVLGRNQPTQRDWRAVTLIASSRLAHRLVVA